MKHYLRHLTGPIGLLLLFASISGCSDAPSLLDTPPLPSTSPLVSAPVDYTVLAEGLGITGPGAYSGYEALVLSIIHYQELQQRGELTDEQAQILTDNIREERFYREVRNGGQGFRQALVDGYILSSLEGTEPAPPDFSITDVARRSGYPFVAYTATRVGPDDAPKYRYNVKLLRLEEDAIADAVMHKPYIYRNSVHAEDGTLLYHIEALLPRKQAIGNRFIRAFERQIRERYGDFRLQQRTNNREPWLQVSKSAGGDEDCYYYYIKDVLVMDCDITVEGERYHCTQDGTCDHGEEEYGGGEEWGDEDGEKGCDTCNNGDDDRKEESTNAIVELTADLILTPEPPDSDFIGTTYLANARFTWNYESPIGPVSHTVSGGYQLLRQKKYFEGKVTFQNVAGGVEAYGAGLSVSYPVKGEGGVTRLGPEITDVEGEFTVDKQTGNFFDNFTCTHTDVSVTWTWNVKPVVTEYYSDGHQVARNPTLKTPIIGGGTCHYIS